MTQEIRAQRCDAWEPHPEHMESSDMPRIAGVARYELCSGAGYGLDGWPEGWCGSNEPHGGHRIQAETIEHGLIECWCRGRLHRKGL